MVGRLPEPGTARFGRLIEANDSPACLVLADSSWYADSAAADQQTGTLTAISAKHQLCLRAARARPREKIHYLCTKTKPVTVRVKGNGVPEQAMVDRRGRPA
jgi:hypothetical protein